MSIEFNYGASESFVLESAEPSSVFDCRTPQGTAIANPESAVQDALRDPLGFPSLEQAVVSGDRVAIAVGRGVPKCCPLLAGITSSLLSATELAAITVVVADADADDLASISSVLPSGVELSQHQPQNRPALSYLAAGKDNKPVYLNKQLCDADVVLPITVSRLAESLDDLGGNGGLFPAFSDEATRNRFQSADLRHWDSQRRRRIQEADEAAWLLGIQLNLQVVPGLGDSILHIVAGEGPVATDRCRQLCRSAWLHHVPTPAQLVVAGIDGGPQEQTWNNLARSLHAATHAVDEDGIIVLCTQLRQRPGPALQILATMADNGDALHEIRRERSEDALAAVVLAAALQKSRVLLLSELDEGFVEDLGMGHVTDTGEIGRLWRQSQSGLLLGGAQHAFAAIKDRI